MTELRGGLSNVTMLATGDRLRVTWKWALSSLLPGSLFDAPTASRRIFEALPGQGFQPFNQPSALPGDVVIVFDVRLLSKYGTAQSVASVLSHLNSLGYMIDTAVDVTVLELVPQGTGSQAVAAGQQQAISGGNTTASDGNVFKQAKDAVGNVLSVVKLLAIAAVVVAGVVLIQKGR